MLELEELVAIERHHREPVGTAQPQIAQPIRGTNHPLAVELIGRSVRAVDNADFVGRSDRSPATGCGDK